MDALGTKMRLVELERRLAVAERRIAALLAEQKRVRRVLERRNDGRIGHVRLEQELRVALGARPRRRGFPPPTKAELFLPEEAA